MFMASVRHHQVGSPPLGPQTQVAKQLNTTPSKQQDLLLGTQLAADSKPQVALPLLGKQACLRGVKPPPALLTLQQPKCPEVGSPLLGTEHCFKIPAMAMAGVG